MFVKKCVVLNVCLFSNILNDLYRVAFVFFFVTSIDFLQNENDCYCTILFSLKFKQDSL